MRNRLGVGVIGGGVGLRTHVPGFMQTDRANLVALYSPNYARSVALGSKAGFQIIARDYEEVCSHPDIDLVVVASPNQYHIAQVSCALAHGKHVLCEKPLALTTEEAHQLLRLTRDHPGVLAIVNHQLRFNPYIKMIRDIIQSSNYGALFHLRVFQKGTGSAGNHAPWSWSYDVAQGGGVRWAMGTHLVDVVKFLTNSVVSTVMCSSHVVVPQRTDGTRRRPVAVASEFSASLLLQSGVQVYTSAIAAAHSKFSFEIDAFLEHAELHFDLDSKLMVFGNAGRKIEQHRDLSNLKPGEIENSPSLFAGSFRYYADAICHALLDGDPAQLKDASTFSDSYEGMCVLDACLDSARAGHSVIVGPSPTVEGAP